MRLLLAAATALVMIPVAASATTWYLFYKDADTSWHIDADSIRKNGQWTGVDQYARYHQVSARTGVKSIAARLEIDCRRHVYRLARFEAFDAQGKSMGAMDNPEAGQEHESVPNSANGTAMKFVCDNDRAGKQRVDDPSRD